MNRVPQDLVYMSAAQQSAAIKKREISPVDLVRASLDRIERYDGKLRASRHRWERAFWMRAKWVLPMMRRW
jgi:Asp-tRNA(Asn)/Glu-tRNA(Gln) amidotransferase A subunit family amidase